MCLDFYTLECRVFGQAERAQTRCECTALTKPIEILAISMEREAQKKRCLPQKVAGISN
jgi:hypothetical protein